MMSRLAPFALTAALLAGPAAAQSGVEIGVLTCNLTDVSNVVVYTTQEFDCAFNPAAADPEPYAGKITKIGIDLSVKRNFTIVWTVLAPTDTAFEPGSLAGTYVGTGADIAIGAGVGAKILVGGGANSFSLQPISVAGMTGGGAALGIESFELTQ